MASSPSIRIAVAYHSGYGHTARQAEAVARGAAGVPGAVVDLLNVAELSDELQTMRRSQAVISSRP